MKLIKLFSVMFLSIQLFLCSPEIINATSESRLIDNDPVVSGYSGSCNDMTYYSGLSGSFNGDMRLSSTGINGSYRWNFPSIKVNSTHCLITLYYYLNNVNFTDKQAKYMMMTYPIEGEGAGYMGFLGYVNQNNAPAGWWHIYTSIDAPYGFNSISSSCVSVSHSSTAGVQLGADAIEVYAYY